MLAAAAQTGMKKIHGGGLVLIGCISSLAPVHAGAHLACPIPTATEHFIISSDGIPLVAYRTSDPLCQCRNSKSLWVVRRCRSDDALCSLCAVRRGCLLSPHRSYYSTISEIYASIVGVWRCLTNFELLNTISAGLRLRLHG